MKAPSRRILALAFLVAAGSASSEAGACGFDGVLGASFGFQHPKSLAVAFAIRDAVDAGAVEAAATAPIEPGPKGYWRAASRVQNFSRRMAAAKGAGDLPDVSLLFVESQLWSRLKSVTSGVSIDLHADGPATKDVVIVTNETVLASVLAGALSPRAAIDLGVIAFDGDKAAAEVVRSAFIERMSRPDTEPSGRSVATIPFVRRR
jgi:hypothetical protein